MLSRVFTSRWNRRLEASLPRKSPARYALAPQALLRRSSAEGYLCHVTHLTAELWRRLSHYRWCLGLGRQLLTRPHPTSPYFTSTHLTLTFIFRPAARHFLLATLSFTSQLTNSLQSHYIGALLRQLYKIVGSFDFLGDPVGVLSQVWRRRWPTVLMYQLSILLCLWQ